MSYSFGIGVLNNQKVKVMKMKNGVSLILLRILLLGVIFSTFYELEAQKMNILFIPVDDLKPMIGAYGNTSVKTPNIDRLAESGTVFLNTSCQQAICGPSRASLLTGMYPDHTQVWDLRTKMRDKNPNILSIPQYFKEQGYITAGVGKTFDSRCVDSKEFMDKPSWSIPYIKVNSKQYANPEVTVAWKKAEKLVEGIKFRVNYERAKAISDLGGPMCRPSTESMDVADDTYADGANARAGIKMLEKLAKSKQPFFLSVGFSKPHLPFVAPKKYWDIYDANDVPLSVFQDRAKNSPNIAYKGGNLGEISSYSDIPNKGPLTIKKQKQLVHGYMAAISYVDAQVGLLLNKLKELGIENNTVVILWGDHGFHLGDHGLWTKHTNFEQAVRSPMIISAPKGFKANINKTPTEFVDIFPTLCELADLDIPNHLHGKSLVPLMKDPSTYIRFAALSQYPRGANRMGYTLRSERFRYVKWINMNYRSGERTGKLIATELYDYENDPLETVNLSDDIKYSKIVKAFEDEFTRRNVAQLKKIK